MLYIILFVTMFYEQNDEPVINGNTYRQTAKNMRLAVLFYFDL